MTALFGNLNLGCHGIPERCLRFGNWRMTICARCTGSVIGHVAAFFAVLFSIEPDWKISVAMLVPIAIDWSLQEFLHVPSTNLRRLITGLLGGFGLGVLIWSGVWKAIEMIIS